MSSLKHGLVFSSCVLGTDTEHVCLPEHTLQKKCIVKVFFFTQIHICRYILYNHNKVGLFFPVTGWGVALGIHFPMGVATPRSLCTCKYNTRENNHQSVKMLKFSPS